jgi:hypothetical protein
VPLSQIERSWNPPRIRHSKSSEIPKAILLEPKIWDQHRTVEIQQKVIGDPEKRDSGFTRNLDPINVGQRQTASSGLLGGTS